jgi:hypothetical protein
MNCEESSFLEHFLRYQIDEAHQICEEMNCEERKVSSFPEHFLHYRTCRLCSSESSERLVPREVLLNGICAARAGEEGGGGWW